MQQFYADFYRCKSQFFCVILHDFLLTRQRMANLTIDIGNSSAKVALFIGEKMEKFFTFPQLTGSNLVEIFTNFAVEKAILSSVLPENGDLNRFLSDNCKRFICLNTQTSLPLTIAYKTPETLGRDRIAAAVGAWALAPNKNSLIIDAGTCNTYDFVDSKGVFCGGNIAPGLDMRLKAMHQFTGLLPNVAVENCEKLLGDTTQTAMLCGALNGVIYEIDGLISDLKAIYSEISVFITGGYAFYFEKRIKNCNFAVPNLVHIGLNKILAYNDTI